MAEAPKRKGAARLYGKTPKSEAEPPDDWWKLYSDPQLDGLLAEAFAANGQVISSRGMLAPLIEKRIAAMALLNNEFAAI